jgi:hypothetical protein
MDWAVRQLTEQWAIVLPVLFLLFGAVLGWGTAWTILRAQRQRERLEAHKERPGDAVVFPKKIKKPASAVAKRLKEFWSDGTTLSQRIVQSQDDKSKWFEDATEWKDAVAGYLKSVGLGEESSMFETLPVKTMKQFPRAFDVEHNAGLNEFEQRMGRLRRVLARAEQRAASAAVRGRPDHFS